MRWWPELWRRRARDWIAQPLRGDQVPGGVDPAPATPDVYLSVFLASMRVVDVRRGLSRFYGAVDSTISVPHVVEGVVDYHVVTTPGELKKVDAKHLDRVVQFERRLLGPVPYRGGDVAMEIGLFSIKEDNLAGAFLELLEQLSNLAGVGVVSSAMAFAAPLVRGIELLTGSADAAMLEVGLAGEWSTPSTGYLLAMRAPRDRVDVGALRVEGGNNEVRDGKGQIVGKYPYILLRIETATKRDDWHQIPSLRAAYAVLLEEVRRGRRNAATAALATFQRTAKVCPDLLPQDGARLAELVREEVRTALPAAQMGATSQELPKLERLPLFA